MDNLKMLRVSYFYYIIVLALSRSNFKYLYCIGKGGFGKVWKVSQDGKYFAMK